LDLREALRTWDRIHAPIAGLIQLLRRFGGNKARSISRNPSVTSFISWDRAVFQNRSLQRRGPPPRIENFAKICIRLGVALISVGFIIVPMVVLAYIDSKEYVLVAAACFASCFAIFFSLCTGLRYHQVVGVIAVYSGVLVVFVGNTILVKSS